MGEPRPGFPALVAVKFDNQHAKLGDAYMDSVACASDPLSIRRPWRWDLTSTDLGYKLHACSFRQDGVDAREQFRSSSAAGPRILTQPPCSGFTGYLAGDGLGARGWEDCRERWPEDPRVEAVSHDAGLQRRRGGWRRESREGACNFLIAIMLFGVWRLRARGVPRITAISEIAQSRRVPHVGCAGREYQLGVKAGA